MKRLAARLSLAILLCASGSTFAAETCRFIEARAEREQCYQRQEAERAARQKANEIRQSQQKAYEPMTQEDAVVAKSLRGICRGC
ncbi:MAG: hypothetical protein PS018_03760 [bacterium]|nr:hypothetical protein [bacterium]